MKVLEYLRSPSRIWAIEEGAWEEMVTIVKGENPSIEAIEASLGKKLDNQVTNALNIIDGVAVIPVVGPIVKYGNLFSQISGATSVSKLTRDFYTALESDEVKAVLFNIDSPGGEANGINEFAESIYQARGHKPIQAYISGQGCSAAYWIASACDKIAMDDTAIAGSIGVAAVVKDTQEKEEKEGIKNYKFVSEGSENKRPDLATDEGQVEVMKTLNAMAQVFRNKVARNRSNDNLSLTVRDVIEKFNRGGVLLGADAVNAGLADELSSYKEVLSNLITKSGESASLEEQEIIMDNNINAGAVAPEENAEVTALKTTLESLESEKIGLVGQIEELTSKMSEIESQLAAVSQEKVSIQDENLKLKAEAKADTWKDRMTVKQRASFVPTYVQLAKDDASNPIEGKSRLDTFLDMWAASEPHNLEEEILEPVETKELENDASEGDDFLAELDAIATSYAKTQNQKLAKA